jgi:hypothetical protein
MWRLSNFCVLLSTTRPIKITTVATSAAKELSFTISPHVPVGAFMAARFSQPGELLFEQISP